MGFLQKAATFSQQTWKNRLVFPTCGWSCGLCKDKLLKPCTSCHCCWPWHGGVLQPMNIGFNGHFLGIVYGVEFIKKNTGSYQQILGIMRIDISMKSFLWLLPDHDNPIMWDSPNVINHPQSSPSKDGLFFRNPLSHAQCFMALPSINVQKATYDVWVWHTTGSQKATSTKHETFWMFNKYQQPDKISAKLHQFEVNFSITPTRAELP